MTNLLRPFDLFDDLHKHYAPFFGRESEWLPPVDIHENKDQFTILMDVPGLTPDDIEITLANDVLTVKGSREGVSEEEKAGYVRSERYSGTFTRQFRLPQSAVQDGLEAKVKDGVLTLTVPRRKESLETKISVS